MATSSFSWPIPGRSTLPRPSGHRSPSASSSRKMYCMFRVVKSYISSRNALSPDQRQTVATAIGNLAVSSVFPAARSEEHTSELQSRRDLVCRLLLEKKKKKQIPPNHAKKKKKKNKKNKKKNRQ